MDTGLLKLLVLLIVVGGILFYVVDFLDLDFFGSESRNPKREERKRENPTAVQAPPPAKTPPFQTQKVVCAQQSAGKTSLPAKPDANAPLAATGIVQTTTADASNVVLRAIEKQGKTRTRKLVLTDGTSIRTRPDGTIEVPRTFSYAGARLRKPFWIYDRQLEKSGRIENEARAQKAAMDKWKALYDEVVKTAEPPAPARRSAP